MSADKRVPILGSTGSIGTQALDHRRPGRPEAAGLAVGRDWQTAVAQAKGFSVGTIAVADEIAAAEATVGFDGNVLAGSRGDRVIGATAPTSCRNGIVRAAGLGPTIAVPTPGASMSPSPTRKAPVIGGSWSPSCLAAGAKLLPVDSEHSAPFPAGRKTRTGPRSTASSYRFRGPSVVAVIDQGITVEAGSRPSDMGDGRPGSRSTRQP